MCDFKPGDEVVLFQYMEDGGDPGLPPIGHIGTITAIGRSMDGPEIGLQLHNWDLGPTGGMNVLMFRKIHPRGLSGWVEDLAAKRTDFEEPKRTPARAPESA
ncbi:hypothetical protein [Brevundimonas viscosa]|uniref:Uncharacterized protein n=1 Tax=Brevundimonas viscosa TaxID=871741 RepID=A0A1I6PRE0_9CAUL|nr:hypothetical protein [Brevundimonas viscosa]SFS42638.1 hypothetical protein SAMN05192570_1201 [Brevundimonas viscosa]